MPVNLNGQHILAKKRKEEVNFLKSLKLVLQKTAEKKFTFIVIFYF